MKLIRVTQMKLSGALRATLSAVLVLTLAIVTPAEAAIISPATPQVTFTFDDGPATNFTKSAPILSKYNLSGTAYITTGCVGMTKVPNTCHADQDISYMTWAQIKSLKNTYGWEIGSHTHTHPYMASKDADDGQPKELTDAQVINELKTSKSTLAAQGINATSYESPYGDYDPFVLQEVAKLYTSHRGFADQRDNTWPYNDLLLNNMQVQYPVSVASVKAKIDYAIANKLWLVLTFHDIVDRPSTNADDYQWGTAQLEAIASYVNAKRSAGALKAVNASGGLATGATNLLPGSDFTAGIANGWRTDRPAYFVADSQSNGSIPEVKSSIRINANNLATDAHLFSPNVKVNADTMYLIKLYLNVKSITKGEVGFYIDEYDATGNWVSGQYKAREAGVFAQNINMSYVPSSPQVKQASLQVYSTAGSRAAGYLDSTAWYAVATGTSNQQNLLIGGDFSNPWGNGWTTDSPDVVLHDAPKSAMSAQVADRTVHLFSPKIGVDTSRSYYFETYLNMTQSNNAEIGVYIDEYDTAGNWVSGQYKLTHKALGAQMISTTYEPTSSSVRYMQVQYIFVGGNGLTVYLDDAQLWRL